MIDLDGDANPREPLNEKLPAMEIYEEFLRYRGRTIRVQEASVHELEEPPAKRGGEPTRFESRSFSDQLGTLSRLRLSHSDYFYPNGERSSRVVAYLTLFLDGEELEYLSLNRARIHVLQEDTGNWELIFQGSEWTDFDRNYLRIYS